MSPAWPPTLFRTAPPRADGWGLGRLPPPLRDTTFVERVTPAFGWTHPVVRRSPLDARRATGLLRRERYGATSPQARSTACSSVLALRAARHRRPWARTGLRCSLAQFYRGRADRLETGLRRRRRVRVWLPTGRCSCTDCARDGLSAPNDALTSTKRGAYWNPRDAVRARLRLHPARESARRPECCATLADHGRAASSSSASPAHGHHQHRGTSARDRSTSTARTSPASPPRRQTTSPTSSCSTSDGSSAAG